MTDCSKTTPCKVILRGVDLELTINLAKFHHPEEMIKVVKGVFGADAEVIRIGQLIPGEIESVVISGAEAKDKKEDNHPKYHVMKSKPFKGIQLHSLNPAELFQALDMDSGSWDDEDIEKVKEYRKMLMSSEKKQAKEPGPKVDYMKDDIPF